MLSDAVENQQDAVVQDRIAHVAALAARGRHSLVTQYAQVLADDRLSALGRCNDLAHCPGFSFAVQIVQDPQAQGMGDIADNR